MFNWKERRAKAALKERLREAANEPKMVETRLYYGYEIEKWTGTHGTYGCPPPSGTYFLLKKLNGPDGPEYERTTGGARVVYFDIADVVDCVDRRIDDERVMVERGKEAERKIAEYNDLGMR